MFRRSLTAKILIAVGVTVALIIAIYTYFVIRVQNVWWHDRTQAQNLIAATMVHEYLQGVMLSERHEEVAHFLRQLKKSGEIARGRVVRPDGTVAFSTETQELNLVQMQLPAGLFDQTEVLQGTRSESHERFTVAMLPVFNHAGCAKCHGNQKRELGAIVLEKSLAPAEASIASNRNLLIAYGIVILALVWFVLWLLIVRLVKQPVSNVLEQIRRVQAGDLRARVRDETPDEIGELARGFNAMVISLETTTDELHASHQRQIQQAGKLASIGELAAGIAHEIRNPLAGIGAAVEVLSESGGGPKSQYGEIVAEIRQQIHRLNNTLRGLLDFARQSEPEIVPCEVRDVVKPMLGLVRVDALKQKIRIVEEYAPELPAVCVDPHQLQQALLNILLNAVQAMPDGGTLTVRAEPLATKLCPGPEHSVRITITDTGRGIAPENLGKIFSPFYTTKHRGTGLGLAITRSVIEKHHGTITVESQVGKGTTVVLELVACQPEVLCHA